MNRDFNSPHGNQNKSSLSLLSEHGRNNKKSYGKHIAIFFKDSNKIISFPIRQNPPSISHHISMKRYFLLPEHRRSAYSYLPFGQTASSSYVAQYQKGKKPALLLQWQSGQSSSSLRYAHSLDQATYLSSRTNEQSQYRRKGLWERWLWKEQSLTNPRSHSIKSTQSSLLLLPSSMFDY